MKKFYYSDICYILHTCKTLVEIQKIEVLMNSIIADNGEFEKLFAFKISDFKYALLHRKAQITNNQI